VQGQAASLLASVVQCEGALAREPVGSDRAIMAPSPSCTHCVTVHVAVNLHRHAMGPLSGLGLFGVSHLC
jgi:hypothetical protein